ncbi:CubicO group peptidase (beta-lactamase class C family) [Novosphingobium kunmingense]|uniref:CubicO group peptidase (Beta-lactamase class C family) n=2 Tax=Novosphingobium kunmingense TaxID=1211806 RepID=A0A2N0H3R0_9SPHN|nr:CubicO group peptidase (beta-lactamase class C family) [Novosphingobium kunmingense]
MMRVFTILAGAAALATPHAAIGETLPGCSVALAYSQAHQGLAVLVLRDGEVVCSSAKVDEPHEVWSGTKSLVGLMAAAAVQDGMLRLDETAANTLTEWRSDPQKSTVTLRQLLSMTAGQPSAVGRPQGYADSLKIALVAAPGTRFQYGPAPMQIIGEVMRRKLIAAGQDPNPRSYIERRLLAPIGVRVAEWRNGPDGNPLMAQGLVLSAREWVKIGEFVRAGGTVGGRALVDKHAFAELFQGTEANAAYGLTWWLPRQSASRDPVTRTADFAMSPTGLPRDMVVAAGAGDQRLYVIPSQRLTIVRQARLDLAALLMRSGGADWSDRQFLTLLLGK